LAEREQTSPAARPPAPDKTDSFRCRTRELFRYLISTFQTMLPAERAEQFDRVGVEVESCLEDNCRACLHAQREGITPRDPRRTRFLLRLVVSRVSHRFAGDKATMPRSLIEGVDQYLRKAFGQIIYDELNAEADQILYDLNIDDDYAMWEHIRKSPPMRRFVDTVFIRILFRFESFPAGKKTFVSIVDRTMQDLSHVSFTDENFYGVFEDLFSHLWRELKDEEQRLRWDFMFGDGTSKRLVAILKLGLERWLKRQEGGAALSTQRAAATAREQSRLASKGLADAPRPARRN
jgi:hypothetical protein